jgi:hypothetical protein
VTRTPTRRQSRGSTSSRRVDPAELGDFAGFCGELTLENGEPLELHKFQQDMLRDFFAGTTETLILISKKNGKSTLLSALALYHLVVTPDAECVIAAASRDQAQIMLRQARGFIRRSEALRRLMEPKQREISSLVDDGRIRVLASDVDTADGVIPTLALVDELHRHKSADLYGVFRDGLGPRDGRMITISTAGDDVDSPLGMMRSAAYRLPVLEVDGTHRFAASTSRDYVMHEWSLDDAADRADMRVVKQANPAPWHSLEALARRHDSPSMTPWQWARFACGVWLQGEDTAIGPVEWAACGTTMIRRTGLSGVSASMSAGKRTRQRSCPLLSMLMVSSGSRSRWCLFRPPRRALRCGNALFWPKSSVSRPFLGLPRSFWTRRTTVRSSRRTSRMSLALMLSRIRRSRRRWLRLRNGFTRRSVRASFGIPATTF